MRGHAALSLSVFGIKADECCRAERPNVSLIAVFIFKRTGATEADLGKANFNLEFPAERPLSIK
jgi:hypothetical protein